MYNQIYLLLGLIFALGLYCGCASDFQRIDPAPEEVFVKLHGGGYDQFGAALLTTDQGYLLAGTSFTPSLGREGHMYVVETDEGGNHLHTINIAPPIFRSSGQTHDMIRTSDQGYLLCGTAFLPSGQSQAWLAKLDANFDISWNHLYGDPNSQQSAVALAEGQNGMYFALGTSTLVDPLKADGPTTAEDSTDLYLISIDPNAPEIPLWEKTIGYTGIDQGVDLLPIESGNLAVLGTTDFPENGSLDKDVLLVLINEEGNVYHTMNIGDAGQDEFARKMILTPDKQLAITGSINQREEEKMMFLTVSLLLEPDALPITILATDTTSGHDISLMDDGNFLIIGSGVSEEDQDVLLLAIDPNGSPVWGPVFFGDEGPDTGVAVLQDNEGITLLGTIQFGSQSMMSLIKTHSDGSL